MAKRSLTKDIINSFVSVAKGMWVTLVHWSPARKSVTELYPEQKPNLPEAYRGVPSLPYDPETGKTKCIACGMCAKVCPEKVITVILDKTDPKDRKPAEFTIDISRCMWCGLCCEACPTGGLVPGRDFELACRDREHMVYNLEDLKKMGGELERAEKAEEEKEEQKEES